MLDHIDAMSRYADARADQRRRAGQPSCAYQLISALSIRWPRSIAR